ncbi:MAG: hypothetical protein PHU46_10600 [Rhodocyclaceae bacterium]|nr:hypothetical protein [Rhodocyclaceae bacterium]
MSDKLFVFLVTADEAFIQLHKERLGREFDLNVLRSRAECQAALNDRQPQLLILDTSLPDGDGFVLHWEIREDFMTSDVYQILLCSETQVARDDFVANDFLLKPFGEETFWRKLALVQKVFEDNARVREQTSYAQGVALTAMSAMGELGVVMQFLSKSFACENIPSVADLALDALRQYELQGVVQFLWEGDSYTATTDGNSPTEEQLTLIAQRRTLGRLLEIEQNLVVNFDHVSILLTNMPDDAQRCGRIRDNVATLAEGVESRIQGLLLEHDNILKQQGIRYAVFEVRDSVKNLDVRQLEDLHATRHLVNMVIDDFEDAFLHMGMVPEVENQLIGQLVTLRQKVTGIVGRPSEVHEKLQSAILALETLAGKVALPS